MSKKSKRIAVVFAVLFVAISILIFTIFQRQYRNVLLEMIIYPSTLAWGNSYRVYRFVVQNDGTFISYSGISIGNSSLVERFDILMWPIVRRRSRITLSDEDFQNISEMASILLENQATPLQIMSQWQMTLSLDENIYHSGLEFYKIVDELIRLSSLTSHDPLITTELLELLAVHGGEK